MRRVKICTSRSATPPAAWSDSSSTPGSCPRGVELIVAVSNDEIAALKRTRASVPVIMSYGGLPVELGFIRSHALPGENITGTEYHSYETAGKIVGLLKEAVPA